MSRPSMIPNNENYHGLQHEPANRDDLREWRRMGVGSTQHNAGNPAERKGGMNISELKTSKYLRKEDCKAGVLLTIESVGQENLAKDGEREDLHWCVYFEETPKPLVLNAINGQLIALITGSEESDDWIGHQVVLYHDPNVSYAGKLIGGIRCRAPKVKPGVAMPKARAKAPAAEEEPPLPTEEPGMPVEDDDLPF